jgi:predicted Zn-dependent peptidase
MFTVSAGLDKTRLPEALGAIWSELKKMKDTNVSADELRCAKDHVRGKWMLAFEDSATQADWYGKQLIFQGKTASPDERMKAIDAVKASDIRRLAGSMFDEKRIGVSVVGPFKNKKEVEKIIAVHLV